MHLAPIVSRRAVRPLCAAAVVASLVAAPAIPGRAQTTGIVEGSACYVITAPDAPSACIEALPIGESAWVTFDGQPFGLSPVVVPEVTPGTHTIRLDRTGYAPWVSTFDIGAAEILRFDPDLVPVPPPGVPVLAEVEPIAVMIENHDEARPQAGLPDADVVYEALAEGGISRFLALYMTGQPEIVGPVRSTRHYFVYTAAEFNATLVHVGASPIGYAALTATGIRNLNESWGDAGVWRSSRRAAPHNAYTTIPEAREYALAKGEVGLGSWGPLQFKDPAATQFGAEASRLFITYVPGGYYTVEYRYDPETNTYLRWMDRVPHRDATTGQQIAAQNVIVQVVPDEVIDREGRLDLAQTGEGQAFFLLDGVVVPGTWTKADFGSQTFFWDTAGNPMRVNPGGTTWIQIVPRASMVEIS